MARTSRHAIVFAVIGTLCAGATPARAEALWTQGIGVANCGRLAADLKPTDGLTNPVNLMLYAWTQGYISAANISMLEADKKHLDMNVIEETKILDMVLTFCKANPDKKPINAIDDFLRKTAKAKATWESGSVKWDQ